MIKSKIEMKYIPVLRYLDSNCIRFWGSIIAFSDLYADKLNQGWQHFSLLESPKSNERGTRVEFYPDNSNCFLTALRTGILSANTMVNPTFIRIGMTNERKSLLRP